MSHVKLHDPSLTIIRPYTQVVNHTWVKVQLRQEYFKLPCFEIKTIYIFLRQHRLPQQQSLTTNPKNLFNIITFNTGDL